MIEITLLGRVAVTIDGEPLTGEAAQRRRLALLALLCARPASRDRLMVQLWPDNDTESARHLLSASLHVLRKALGAETIVTSGDQVELSRAHVRVDAIEFEEAVHRGEFERAVTLYGGAFLEGLFLSNTPEFEQWVDSRRQELTRLCVSALEGCAQGRSAAGDLDGASDAWRRLAALDPFSARTTVGLMLALTAAGNRAAALQAARVHEQLLESEFGAAPEPEVTRLAEQLRREPPAPSDGQDRSPAAELAHPPPPISPTPGLLAVTPPGGDSGLSRRPSAGAARALTAVAEPLRNRLVVAAVLVAALIVGVSVALWRWPTAAGAAPRVIAVVPLASRGSDGSDDYIAAGIAWHIIDELGRASQLRVVNSASSFVYRDSAQNVRSIGQHLRADALLTVSARTAGEELRVVVELVRVADGLRSWGNQYEGRRDRIFTIEDAVATSVSEALGVPRAASRPGAVPVNSEAHHLYMQGRYAWSQRTPASLRVALDFFRQSVEADPSYAWGYVGLADTYNMLGSYDYGVLAPDSAFPRARAAAERALVLAPAFEPAHAALANVRMNYDWNWVGAEKEYRRAIELNPGYTASSEWLAGLLIARRRLPEALALLLQAAQYNPASPLMFTNLGHYYYYARDFNAALRHLEHALKLDPGFGRAHVLRGLVLCQAGHTSEAIAIFEQLAAEHRDDDPIIAGLLGYAYARAGRRDDALMQAAWLAERAQIRYLPVEYEALVYQGLGDTDRVFDILDRALERRSGILVYLQVEPLLDPLRQLPRFQQLVTRVHGAPGGDAR